MFKTEGDLNWLEKREPKKENSQKMNDIIHT